MKARPPQLPLRLDAALPVAAAPWREGGRVAYLGGELALRLDTDRRLPERIEGELHLPLPPAATPRQIRDAAESWLRDEAQRLFQESALATRRRNDAGQAEWRPARVVLSFGKGGDWAVREEEVLRCHWRLIEQPPAIIAQVLARALATPATEPACADLFACA